MNPLYCNITPSLSPQRINREISFSSFKLLSFLSILPLFYGAASESKAFYLCKQASEYLSRSFRCINAFISTTRGKSSKNTDIGG